MFNHSSPRRYYMSSKDPDLNYEMFCQAGHLIGDVLLSNVLFRDIICRKLLLFLAAMIFRLK